MEYYIQGNAAKAQQIKAAFEKLGYEAIAYCFNSERTLYFTFGGAIKTATYEPYKSIIKTHPDYQELELPVWTIADAKDGDVLCTYECGEPKIVFIYKNGTGVIMYYCFYNIMYPRFDANNEPGCLAPKREDVKPATKEQHDLLFRKMKEAGYEWDSDKKELLKIKHYAIANFHAGMPVLVRDEDSDDDEWTYALFSHYSSNRTAYKFSASGEIFRQCIPFNEETKHLLGTTDMCDKQYINW